LAKAQSPTPKAQTQSENWFAMIDLLAFGPHPDDIEIGLGGTAAKQAGLGLRVALCDLTAGEMGSNGTVEERLAEAESARAVLGAVWRENLRWPDRRIGKDPAHLEQAVEFIRRHRPRTIAVPYWSDRHPDHAAASEVLTEAAFNAGLRRYPAVGEPWRAEWVCYYFINDAAEASFVIDVTDYYDRKREALDCHASQFQAARSGAAATRLNTPLFRQLIESRDAQFGALAGVRWAEGFVVREPIVRASLVKGA
jgi:bacillithiol biosynthesis deacetylase BshB1